jgi:hypothetical protein
VYGFKNIKRCKLVIENHLNRYLHPNEDVHHVDFDQKLGANLGLQAEV